MIAGSRLISLAAALPWIRTGYDYALFSFSMVHITDCRFVVEFRDHNYQNAPFTLRFSNQFSWKRAIIKAFYEAQSRGWHQNFLLVHVSGSRVAELEMHLLAAKVNYCTQ